MGCRCEVDSDRYIPDVEHSLQIGSAAAEHSEKSVVIQSRQTSDSCQGFPLSPEPPESWNPPTLGLSPLTKGKERSGG